MFLTTLLYVSTGTFEPDRAAAAVEDIVATSVAFNSANTVTGALLFTGAHFAQLLEGDAGILDDLMARIYVDVRHRDVTVVHRAAIDVRRFDRWSMAYFGPSRFVARHVLRLLNEPSPVEQRRAAGWLADLLHEFTRS